MELKGKCAVVTGSTKGIGRAIAEALVKEGASVVVSSRHQQEVDETVAALREGSGVKVAGKTCDVRQVDEVRDLIHFGVDQLGGLDVLVNNAGIGIFNSVEEMSPQEWRDVIATNLDSLFYGCHFAIPQMKKNGGGFIINIGSLAGKNAFPQGSAYNASKFGLVGFSEALMQEVRYDDIRVVYIMPGSVETHFRGNQPQADSWKIAAEDVAEVVVQTIRHHNRCLTSRIEMRPSKPPKK